MCTECAAIAGGNSLGLDLYSSGTTTETNSNPYGLVLWVESTKTILWLCFWKIDAWNCVITTRRKLSSLRPGYFSSTFPWGLYAMVGLSSSFCNSLQRQSTDTASLLWRCLTSVRRILHASCLVMKVAHVAMERKLSRFYRFIKGPLIPLEVGNVGLYKFAIQNGALLNILPTLLPDIFSRRIGKRYVFNLFQVYDLYEYELMHRANTFPLVSFCVVILGRQYTFRDPCRFRVWKLFF